MGPKPPRISNPVQGDSLDTIAMRQPGQSGGQQSQLQSSLPKYSMQQATHRASACHGRKRSGKRATTGNNVFTLNACSNARFDMNETQSLLMSITATTMQTGLTQNDQIKANRQLCQCVADTSFCSSGTIVSDQAVVHVLQLWILKQYLSNVDLRANGFFSKHIHNPFSTCVPRFAFFSLLARIHYIIRLISSDHPVFKNLQVCLK